MSLVLEVDQISYEGKDILIYDDFDGVYIDWENVEYFLNNIRIPDIVNFDIVTKTIDIGIAANKEKYLVKGYCMALMYARNYGFLRNIDEELYEQLWEDYKKSNQSIKTNEDPFETELTISKNFVASDLNVASYEDYHIFENKLYVLCSSVNWKPVVKSIELWEENDDLDPDILLALGLFESMLLGLDEGKPY